MTLIAFAALFRIPEYWTLFTVVMILAVVSAFCAVMFGIVALFYPGAPREWARRAAVVLAGLASIGIVGWIVSHLQAH